MATTKKAVKFYADQDIEQYLDTIPGQLRTNWINQALRQAIQTKQEVNQSELAQLKDWLENKPSPTPLEGALAELLTGYVAGKS